MPTASEVVRASAVSGMSQRTVNVGAKPKIEHQEAEHRHRDGEVEQVRPDRRDRQQETREVDLLDEVRGPHEAVGGADEALREERPGHEAGEGEERVRDALRRDPLDPAKEER